jgi:hypothetical protein
MHRWELLLMKKRDVGRTLVVGLVFLVGIAATECTEAKEMQPNPSSEHPEDEVVYLGIMVGPDVEISPKAFSTIEIET